MFKEDCQIAHIYYLTVLLCLRHYILINSPLYYLSYNVLPDVILILRIIYSSGFQYLRHFFSKSVQFVEICKHRNNHT